MRFMYTQQITVRNEWDASKLPLDYPPDDLGALPGQGLKEYSSPNPARTLPVISCYQVPETVAGHHPNTQSLDFSLNTEIFTLRLSL